MYLAQFHRFTIRSKGTDCAWIDSRVWACPHGDGVQLVGSRLPCSLIVIASRASALIWVSLQLYVFCQSSTWASVYHPRHSQPVFLLESQLHSVGRDNEAHTCSHYKTSLELWHADFSLKKSHGNPYVHNWEHHWIV